MKNSKFNSLFEGTYNRYTQGNGFLVGDVVKVKSGYENMESFKKLGENVKQRVKDAIETGNNLRVGRLHNYSAGSRYSAEGASQAPADLADCYVEYAPGMVANLMTLPVECLEEVDTGMNLAPVPDGQKDMRDRTAEGEKEFKSKATNEQTKSMKKQTRVEKGDYELAIKNTKLAHSNKHNDMQPPKVKGMQKAKNINESQALLEDLYFNILTEDVGVMSGGDAGAQQDESESSLRMPNGTVVDTQKLQSLFAKIDRNMNDNGFYGDIDDAKVYDALRRGDVEGAADEICYSYTGQDGGEVDTEGIFKDVVSSLNYMIRNSKPTGMHPGVGVGEAEMEETFHVQDGETILTNRTALPQTGDYLPAGTPAWVYYMVRQATPEQIKALMGTIKSKVPGGHGYYNDDSMLPRGLRGKTPGVEDEGNEFTGDLAHTQKGDKFKIGGKTVTNTTGQIAEKICPKCGKELCECDTMEESKMKMKDESGLQAYIGKKKYGAADFKALQKAGREHDMKKKEQIKAKHSHHGS
jgi:hypothetical protein